MGGPAYLKRSNDIDAVDMLKIVGRQAIQIRMLDKLGGACIVHQRIESAPFRHGFFNHTPTVFIATDVCLTEQHISPKRTTIGCHRFRSFDTARIVDDNIAAFAGEQPGGCS